MNIIWLPEVDSTNTYVKQNAATLHHGDMVCAYAQTAGRGQRGNSWEATPGCNITCSIILRWQDFPANQQFAISQAVSLAIIDLLRDKCHVQCRIKWPNDIYYQDNKICGILIEHALTGMSLDRTIVGIGININQPEFHSDAPNPISVLQITGQQHSLPELSQHLHTYIIERIEKICTLAGMERTARQYRQHLWRGETGRDYPFYDVNAARTYRGNIHDIATTGHLTIFETHPYPGTLHRYAFKEVEWPL